jgi:hypothetical protein
VALTRDQAALVRDYHWALNRFHDRWVQVLGTDEHAHGHAFAGRVGFAQLSQKNPHRLRVQFLKPGRSPYLGFPPGDSPYEWLEYTPDRLRLVTVKEPWRHDEWWFPKVHLQAPPGPPPKRWAGETAAEWMWRHMVAGVPRGTWARAIQKAVYRTWVEHQGLLVSKEQLFRASGGYSESEPVKSQAPRLRVWDMKPGEVFWVPAFSSFATRLDSTMSEDILLHLSGEEDVTGAVQVPRVGHLRVERPLTSRWVTTTQPGRRPARGECRISPTHTALHDTFMYGNVWDVP